ncbi:MAG TPA: IPT/TIG domain-containing protein, partial [Longimicrobium sp.]
LVPGQTITLRGLNLGSAPTVTVGGTSVPATSAAGGTQLTFVAPCISSGNVAVQAQAGGTNANAVTTPLQVAQRTLGVGESTVLVNQADAGCNEITPSGSASRYVMAVYNLSTTPSSNAPFAVTTGGGASSPAVVAANGAPLARVLSAEERRQEAGDEAHARILEQNAVEYQRLRAHFGTGSAMRANRSAVVAAPVEPPLTRKIRVPRIDQANFCRTYTEVNANRVYYNGKVAIYEDADSTPSALRAANSTRMADYYNRIGDQFNVDMEPIIRNNFGDVLRRDAVTDNNGVLVAVFTPMINRRSAGVAGFVVSCDQFPNDSTAASPVNSSSNFGEYFYAYQPTDSTAATGYATFTPDSWYWSIRATFIHETKHIVSQAARVENGASFYEASWLEEGTARHAEELWARNVVYNVGWKANTGYGSSAAPGSIYCDYRREAAVAGGAECLATNPRRPSLNMFRHFSSLYGYLLNGRFYSVFGAAPDDENAAWYATSWSLARFAIDRYGASDAAFLTALTQSTTTGTATLASVANVPFERLMGEWGLALAIDDYPGMTPLATTPQMPTWNMRNIYAGLNADPIFSGFQAWPLRYHTSFTFSTPGTANVATMRGGGVAWFEISGTQTANQLVKMVGGTAASPTALPSTLRLAIARVE